MVTRTERHKHTDKVHKTKKKNRVKLRKVITVDTNKLKSELSQECDRGKHTITCESWGVIGHWREYKSGKRVWIKPYRKGKKRNDPDASYTSKEYIIE